VVISTDTLSHLKVFE